jgi:hypothetical protein
MNPWILRTIVIILAIAFLPIIVSGAASLITSGIHCVGESIHSILRPLSMRGEAKLKGIIELCLYLVSITILIRFLFGNNR